MTPLVPGTLVTPTIRLVRPLGAGGMGSVWIADHLSLHTQVVVKFIAVELAGRVEAMQRFAREAAAAAQVKSPHVVQMFDHGVTPDGVAFIVMELLEGQDLAHHIAARRRLTLSETAEIIAQTCKALSRAHERGIVHRDIKPDNIFMCASPDGETFVKLLDFGIAKGDFTASASTGTKTGATIGTPFYMSPEQMIGAKDVDGRADLWSLGVVAFECVLGTRPIQGETFGAVAINIHSGPIPVPSSLDPALPPAFDAWFARACARNLVERFASAKEFADTLSYIASGGTSVPPGFRSSQNPMMSPVAVTAGPGGVGTPIPGVGTPPRLGFTPLPAGTPVPQMGFTPLPAGTPVPHAGTPLPGLGAAAVSGGRTISHAGVGLPTPLPQVPGTRRTGPVIAIALGLIVLAGASTLFAVRFVVSPSGASSAAASAGSAPTAARLAASSAPAPTEPPAVSLTPRPPDLPSVAEPAPSPPAATDAAPPTPTAKPEPPVAAKPAAAPPPHAAPKPTPTPSKHEREIF